MLSPIRRHINLSVILFWLILLATLFFAFIVDVTPGALTGTVL